jgi:hypothetical protein
MPPSRGNHQLPGPDPLDCPAEDAIHSAQVLADGCLELLRHLGLSLRPNTVQPGIDPVADYLTFSLAERDGPYLRTSNRQRTALILAGTPLSLGDALFAIRRQTAT